MRRHSKCKPHVHAGGESFDRRIDKVFHAGERDDLVEPPFDLGVPHSEDRAVEKNVLAAGQLGMEAGADLEHAGDAAGELDPSLARLGDAADHL